MADQETAIGINSRVRDIIVERHMEDAGDFSMTFSLSVARLLEAGTPLEAAVESSLQETGTAFRCLNRNNIRGFAEELVTRLRTLPSYRLPDVLLRFKRYAERQLVHGFKKNANEEFCRSNLQTYLEQGGRTTREVQTGGGWIDVLVKTGEPVEAKLWKGREYYEAGIEELREYMRTEGQEVGYYVVFDTFPDNENLPAQSAVQVPEGRIVQIAVRMNPGAPSGRRRARRKASQQ